MLSCSFWGLDAFAETLHCRTLLKNIPSSLIKNPNGKQLVGRGFSTLSQQSSGKAIDAVPPPPGVPVGRPVLDLSKDKRLSTLHSSKVKSKKISIG